MKLTSFEGGAISYQSTLCRCNMSDYTIQWTHLGIHPHTLNCWSMRHRTTVLMGKHAEWDRVAQHASNNIKDLVVPLLVDDASAK